MRLPPLLVLLAISFSMGCYSYPGNAGITDYNLTAGYRFDSLEVNHGERQNSDGLFVVLAFSGGGTRAAALSYGVLAALDRVEFRFDTATGLPCDTSCPLDSKRSLLDEVDVISSVSGGSFPAAYYALHGKEIFDASSAFKTNFLYYPAQRDLLGNLIFRPGNWKYLGSRVELAANQWASIFGDATFASLQRGSRPYLILNSTDVLTGGRFEFSQEQFDLFCGDLSSFPLRRAVAASSAFPGLLTPMTLASHVRQPCRYVKPLWFDHALADTVPNYQLFRRAREMESYWDPAREYLHVMDGGVADNLGLRAILQSLGQEQVPNMEDSTGALIEGGWSLLTMINRGQTHLATDGRVFPDDDPIRNIVVIVVNARTNTAKPWGASPKPPSPLAAINVSAGIPIGRLSWESMDLLRQVPFDSDMNREGRPGFYGFEVAFENIPDPAERDFFVNLATNFQLSRFEVDCLIDRGGVLLDGASSLTERTSRSFGAFIEEFLQADSADVAGAGRTCTDKTADDAPRDPTHFINVGLHYSFATNTRESMRMEDHLGVSLRIARPSGFGALFSIGPRTFDVMGSVAGENVELGDFRLWAWTTGIGYTLRNGRFDITPGLTAGYAFGRFEIEEGLRQRVGQDLGIFEFAVDAPGSWIAQAELHAWVNVSKKFALTGFAQYMYAQPHLGIAGESAVFEKNLVASGLRLGVGAGFRIY